MATAAPQSMDIGRVISKGFEALGKNIVPFFAVAFVLAGLPSFLLQYWLMGMMFAANPETLFLSGNFWMGTGISFLIMMITGAILQGILVRSTILQLSGRPVDVGHSVSLALQLILPLIGLGIMIALCVLFGLMLLIVPGVILYIMLIVSVPALVEERRGVFDSMGRSSQLTQGSRMMIFLLIVIYIIFWWILSMVVGAIFGAGLAVSGSFTTMAVGQAVQATISAVLSAVMISSLYIELRRIKEGATPDSMAAVFA